MGAILFLGAGLGWAQADLAERLTKRVDAFHAEGESVRHELRVVYFHPSDVAPQKGYEARLGRVIADIQAFYRDEMKRNGFGDREIPAEMDGDKLKIHLVKGAEPSPAYDYDSGEKVLKELRTALQGTIDIDREFVLVMGGMCQKEENGKYIFHAPYYGWPGSGHRFGLCFAADCELMDPQHYTNTGATIRYWEHLGDFEKPLSAFNQLYIGGVAHELGHGLGLPHNAESPEEAKRSGTALMGAGNHTYRQEKVGKMGSFLSMASCIRLLSHPLVTQTNRARFAPVKATLSGMNFGGEGKELVISGRVMAEPACYAAIAYTDPLGRSNYDARTWVAEVKEDGSFTVPVKELKPGEGELRLTFCHLNGATTTPLKLSYEVAPSQIPDRSEFSGAWILGRAEWAFMNGEKEAAAKIIEAELKKNPESTFLPQLNHVLQLTYGQGVIKLDAVEEPAAFLSDVEWTSGEVGWGEPARNQYFSSKGIRNSVCLVLGGQFHSKGLYAHAPSRYVYDLKGEWLEFSSIVGMQQGASKEVGTIFVVRGDGVDLYRSEVLYGEDTEEIVIPIGGVKQLELITMSAAGKENNGGCWSIWGSPLVTR